MKLNFDRKYSVNFVPPRADLHTHGWIVVFGACLVFMFNISLESTFNVIFSPIFDNSDNKSVGIAALIYVILSNLTVICTGFMMKDLSAKHFVVIGSALLFVGLVISISAVNLGILIVSYSIVMGIGMGLINPASFIAVLSCFNASRNRAFGVIFASLGLGQLVIPPFANFLLENFTFRIVITFMAGLSLIGFVGAHLLAPIKWISCDEIHIDSNVEENNNSNVDDHNDESRPLLPNRCEAHSHHTVANTIIHEADLELLIDYKFLTLSVGLSFIFALSVDLTKIFPVFLTEKFSIDAAQALTCTNVIQIADIVSRLTFAFITDAFKCSSKTVFLMGLVMTTLIRMLMLIPNLDYEKILFLCSILGIFRAMTVVNQILVIVDFAKGRCPRRVPGMIGLSFVIKSILLTISEHLYENLQNYNVHICTHLFIQFIVIILWTFII